MPMQDRVVAGSRRDRLGDVISDHVDEVAAQALVIGGKIIVGLGVVLLPSIGFMIATADVGSFFVPPLVAALAGASIGTGAWLVGRARQVSRYAGVLVAALALMPTLFFVTAELFVEDGSGAGAYATGPLAHLYAFVVVATGFLLRPRASLLAGGIAAAGFLVTWAMARPELLEVARTTPLLAIDLGRDAIWVFKAVMIFACGGATAAIVVVARRLVARVVDEERENQAVKKLFGEYVSADVRDKILRERGGLKSERRSVAVLFSDLRGFTTYSEKTDPAVVVERLNAYFERMVEAVEREGGVVDKFIGDAIMATFGGVVPLDKPAVHAFRAARAMREALRELNAQWASDGTPPFDNGIGIHFGVVIEGPLGSSTRREYTVIGDTVNTASRLEGITKDKARGVVVSQAFVDALDEASRAALEDLGEVRVKGRDVPLRIWGL